MTDENFTKVPNWLLHTKLNPSTRMVYVALLSHAWNGHRTVWPGVQRIAKLSSTGTTVVNEALRTLTGVGLITVEHSVGTVNRYTILPLSRAEIDRICSLSKAEVRGAVTSNDVDSQPRDLDAPESGGGTPEFGVGTPGSGVGTPEFGHEEDSLRRQSKKTNYEDEVHPATPAAPPGVPAHGRNPRAAAPPGPGGGWGRSVGDGEDRGELSLANKMDSGADSRTSLRERLLELRERG